MSSNGNILIDELSRMSEIISDRLPFVFESTHCSHQNKGCSYSNLAPQVDVIEVTCDEGMEKRQLLTIRGRDSGVYRIKRVPVRVAEATEYNMSTRRSHSSGRVPLTAAAMGWMCSSAGTSRSRPSSTVLTWVRTTSM